METPTTPALLVADTVGVAEFATIQGKTERTVRMWLNNGEVPGATRNDRGVWSIPRDAMRHPRPLPGSTDVESTAPANGVTISDVLDRHAAFLTVEEAATVLGISPYAVRAHADALDGVFWGDNGALVIPQATVRKIAGI